MMNKTFLIVVTLTLFTLLSTGCVKLNAATYRLYDSKSMPESVRTEGKVMADMIEKALISNDSEVIKAHTITSQQSQIEEFALKTAEKNLVDSDQILNIDDFYVTGSSAGQIIEIPVHNEDNSFKVRLSSNPLDQYIRITVLRSPTISYLLLQIYAKEDDQWKLGAVALCDYEYDEMNAQKLLNKIHEMKDSGNNWVAYCYSTILEQLLSSSDSVGYECQSDYESLKNEFAQVDMGLPLSDPVLTEMDGRVTVVSANGIATQQGMALLLYTVTETPLQDSDKLEVAAKKAVETFVERIPEVKQYFKYIVIRQYEEPPIDPNKSYEYLSSVISLME